MESAFLIETAILLGFRHEIQAELHASSLPSLSDSGLYKQPAYILSAGRRIDDQLSGQSANVEPEVGIPYTFAGGRQRRTVS